MATTCTIKGLKVAHFSLMLLFSCLVFNECESKSFEINSTFLGARPYELTRFTPGKSVSRMVAKVSPSQGVKAGYWASFYDFPASSIDTSYFSHIYYAFVLPDPVSYKLAIGSFEEEKIPEFMNAVQNRNPPVKTILSIGGGGNNATVFSMMASSESTRAIFILSTIEVARKYGFDGLDLDWEFPATNEDMSNLAILYKQWRGALENDAKTTRKPRLLLTSAVHYASSFNGFSYPGLSMGDYLDWVSPMCFDYHGSWENITGEHSALYDSTSELSTAYGIGSWVHSGVPPNKIVMGLPLYGRTWVLQNSNDNGIGAPAIGPGPNGGELNYSEILDFNSKNNATLRFDSEKASFYSYSKDIWIGYDDVESILLKVRFAKSRHLGGFFFWALGMDINWTLPRQASKEWGRP